VSAQVRREQAQFAMERGLSQRRACALMQVSRSSLGYTLKMPLKNAPVIEAMCSLSGDYPRFGSRRIRVLLGRVRCNDSFDEGRFTIRWGEIRRGRRFST